MLSALNVLLSLSILVSFCSFSITTATFVYSCASPGSLPQTDPQPAKASTVSVSTLASGLTVITEDACKTSTVTMSYPKAGSASEKPNQSGAALFNKCLNFMSASGISTIVMNRAIEDQGGMMFTDLSRRAAVIGYTVARENAVPLIPLLCTECHFERWDVRDAANHADKEARIAHSSAQIVLTEALYAAAYGPYSAAGRALYSPCCPVPAVQEFRSYGYGLNGAILAATGVKDHSAFCLQAETSLSQSPQGNAEKPDPMVYMGGESRVLAAHTGYAHVAIGFKAPSSSALTAVVKKVFSVLGATVGVSGFANDGGLIGVYMGSSSPATMIDTLTSVITGTVTADVIHRAKVLAKSEALLALDDGSRTLNAALAAAVMNGEIFASPADVAKSFDAVTEAQVKDTITALRSVNPALAAVGDITLIPYQGAVAANLK